LLRRCRYIYIYIYIYIYTYILYFSSASKFVRSWSLSRLSCYEGADIYIYIYIYIYIHMYIYIFLFIYIFMYCPFVGSFAVRVCHVSVRAGYGAALRGRGQSIYIYYMYLYIFTYIYIYVYIYIYIYSIYIRIHTYMVRFVHSSSSSRLSSSLSRRSSKKPRTRPPTVWLRRTRTPSRCAPSLRRRLRRSRTRWSRLSSFVWRFPSPR